MLRFINVILLFISILRKFRLQFGKELRYVATKDLLRWYAHLLAHATKLKRTGYFAPLVIATAIGAAQLGFFQELLTGNAPPFQGGKKLKMPYFHYFPVGHFLYGHW